MAAGSGSYDADADATDAADDQHEFIRSLFTISTDCHGDDDDCDGDDDDISEHTWICPNNSSLSIIYHLTIYAPGHGNRIWNSSACIAQHLLIPEFRSMIIDSTRQRRIEWPPKTCLEFGAGAALPSLALLHEGAYRVILTDSARANNRTFDALHKSVHVNAKVWNISEEELSHRVQIVPHTWGEADELSCALGGERNNNLADLVIASDCIYNPTHHLSLLQSAVRSMSDNGLFIVGYSLHGNVPPDRVLHFFHVAKHEFGLEIVKEVMREYDCQEGIGSNDRNRAVVYVKVLARQLNSPDDDT
ncbi:hypothetical protein ACHAWU_007635 [Discostella pseudostelligera]|uniref:Uncharacterized protein n=1 Tax=Discostella pseudostelligera TaxID=259834 RepID=A0ABD3MD87_9STRA